MGTYEWFPATGLDDPFIANPIATVTGATSYTVTYDDGVCVAVDTVEISYGAGVITSPDQVSICPGDSTSLLAEYFNDFTVPDMLCDLYKVLVAGQRILRQLAMTLVMERQAVAHTLAIMKMGEPKSFILLVI